MYLRIKRSLDIAFSFCIIIVLAPLFIIVSIIILLVMGSPIFFKQERIGLNNKPFVIYKFRSMLHKSEINQTEAQRIRLFGKLMRQFRIDELPQLFNILLGEMSFIGPRPLLPEYLPYYNDYEIRRHKVRPGLSGYSQISNLNYPDWEDQFELDIYYVDHLSLRLDFSILVKTLIKIIRPAKMVQAGYTGRSRFDTYRKQQLEK